MSTTVTGRKEERKGEDTGVRCASSSGSSGVQTEEVLLWEAEWRCRREIYWWEEYEIDALQNERAA